jgi:hypothetical protein
VTGDRSYRNRPSLVIPVSFEEEIPSRPVSSVLPTRQSVSDRPLSGVASTAVFPVDGSGAVPRLDGAWVRQRNWSGGEEPSKATVMICRIDSLSQWSQRGGSKRTSTPWMYPKCFTTCHIGDAR